MKTISTSTGAFQVEKNKDTYRLTISYNNWKDRFKVAMKVLFTGQTPDETIDFVQAKKIANSLTYRPYPGKRPSTASKSQK